ncbi:MAG TPA: IS110 family transposase [Terrimicrobium sp.]
MNKQTDIEIVTKKFALIKIAIDMHLRNYRVVRQIEYSRPQPAQKFAPEAIYGWLEKQRALAERVVVCYEAGCFGYEPARRMQAIGVEVYVIAPQNWDEQGKRQVNDKHDALVMCRRLSEYLAGHAKALSIVRIPSPEEEARRAQGRMREQLCRQIRRMQAMGRSLLLQRGMAVRGRWWRGRTWEYILAAMPSWVIAQLESWKELLELAEKQVRQIEVQLKKAAPGKLLFGEGELTHELLARELIDPQRFGNARQVGNYFGRCPSESTSDQRRRMGSITKHGNPRLRRLMVELAWRVSRLQPYYQGVLRWGALLSDRKASAAARKKAIVALARRLAVDLWRMATGRVQAAELGLVSKEILPINPRKNLCP